MGPEGESLLSTETGSGEENAVVLAATANAMTNAEIERAAVDIMQRSVVLRRKLEEMEGSEHSKRLDRFCNGTKPVTELILEAAASEKVGRRRLGLE